MEIFNDLKFFVNNVQQKLSEFGKNGESLPVLQNIKDNALKVFFFQSIKKEAAEKI